MGFIGPGAATCGRNGYTPPRLQKRILILTAIRMEADAIARQFKRSGPRGNIPVDLPSRMPAVLAVIGMGALRMPDLSGLPYAAIIMAGLAGGLDPHLVVGDIVVDQQSTWRASRIPFRRGKFYTTDKVVETAEEKGQIFERTRAVVAEMENAQVRAAAASYSIPFLGIRSVSDSADESLDPAVLQFIDPFGGVRFADVMGQVFKRPSLVMKLRHLRKSSALALGTLGEAVRQMINPD